MRILSVFGTRPEAIKMAPVALALGRTPGVASALCVSAQHREMLDQVLGVFGLVPDFDLDIMAPNQNLVDITMRVLAGVDDVIARFRPDRILVHGDTTTTFAAALAGFYRQVPVGHVEAGLRTGDMRAPYPEEMNRRFADALADLLFAPTETARSNLLAEGADPSRVFVTGNTVIDALHAAVAMLKEDSSRRRTFERDLPFPSEDRRLILVTGHRRENFGEGFRRICEALAELADRPGVEIVYPVHLNPNVREPVHRLLGGKPHLHLIEPLAYLPFVHLMERCHFVLTDSGGIQEEAPALGKPVLVMRDLTERPEAVAAGTVRLVGTDPARIVAESARLLDDAAAYTAMSSARNPYGDGRAAERIVREIVR